MTIKKHRQRNSNFERIEDRNMIIKIYKKKKKKKT